MPDNFADRLIAAIQAKRTPAIVGIDPVLERLPPELRPPAGCRLADAVEAVERFSRAIVDIVAPLVAAVKINSAFFEAFHAPGLAAYFRLVEHAHSRGLLVIGDVKRGDIGSTAALYARGHLASPRFNDLSPGALPDAVTLAGYLGETALAPFVDICAREGKGVFVLVRPSEPSADLIHEFPGATAGRDSSRGAGRQPADAAARGPLLYEHLADIVDRLGRAAGLVGSTGYSSIGAVVAPKDTESTRRLRERMPHTLWLVPGYGAQGATAEACRPCFNADGLGAIVNASRSVIYAYDAASGGQPEGDWKAAVWRAGREFAATLAAVRPL